MKHAVTVNNLSKMYTIQHSGEARYTTLRDGLTSGFKYILNSKYRHERRSLHKENFYALQDVSFQVKPGERLGIIGRNGAGKSTLLKILSRITSPSAGSIELRGRVGSLLEVGTGFHPELTGRENIYLNGAILGMSSREIRERFDEIVDFAGVEKFLDTPVKRFSSGMYVRLAFAVAAHLEPEILLIDEVLAVGDFHFQKKCIGKINQTASEGRTILFVSHNMSVLKKICSRAILIDQGRISAEGNSDEIVDLYIKSQEEDSCLEVVADLSKIHPKQRREVIIQEGWLEDKDGKATQTINMGDPLKIIYKYCSERMLSNVRFGFFISSLDNQKIFSFNNVEASIREVKQTKKGTVWCSFPEIPLLPGNYTVTLLIIENESDQTDRVRNVLPFQVLPNDLFDTGKSLCSYHGLVYCRGTFGIDL